MYEAKIMKAHIAPHPNADKLKLLLLNGYQVVTGMDIKEGELVCFFPEGGCLSHEFVYENSEYREGKGQNKDPKSTGLFEENRRVRTIRLRGQKSEGYAVPLTSFAYTGATFTEGMSFTELVVNGRTFPICEKYLTPATKARLEKNKSNIIAVKKRFNVLDRHFETTQLRDYINSIPLGAIIYFTEKLHGTSGRTGFLQIPSEKMAGWRGWLQEKLFLFIYRLASYLNFDLHQGTWRIISGSRNVTFNPDSIYKDAYRKNAENRLASLLHLGETAYYEIVGFNDSLQPLFDHSCMGDDDTRKILRKQYGPRMVYKYGTDQNEIYVYRMTGKTADQRTYEYSWEDVKRRCEEMGINYVPELGKYILNDRKELLTIAETLSSGPSSLDSTHIREGICLRIESSGLPISKSILKYKGFEFCHLEGIRKNDSDYVDVEEVA